MSALALQIIRDPEAASVLLEPRRQAMLRLLQNEPNIREVIAFPKTGEGRDLMMGAPSNISEKQLKELGIKLGK